MADPRITADAISSEDVEMEGTNSHLGNGLGGKVANGNGDAHPRAADSLHHLVQTNTPQFKPDPDDTQPTSSPPPSQAGSNKMRPASKKKGTAAKKGPRKSRIPKSKTSKKDPSSTGPANGAQDGSSDDETDNGPYCICRGPDDHRWMISCDVCEDWFHGECVNLDKEVGEKLVERFVCPNCTDGKLNYTKYRKTCSLTGCITAARLYTKNPKERSAFCCNDHCDLWWSSLINTLPTKAASEKAIEVLTQEDFVGLLVSTIEKGGWKLGDQPFGMFIVSWSCFLPLLSFMCADLLLRQHRRPLG